MIKPTWESSNAALYHGNASTVLESIEPLVNRVVITDPPYNFTNAGKLGWHSMFKQVSSGPVVVFAPPENQWVDGWDQCLFWIKPTSTKNTVYRYSRFVEMIFMYDSVNTFEGGRHWSQYTNVFFDFVEQSLHPHMKPLALMERLIRNHTKVGDVIIDPFMGSGTTGVAALRSGRKFIGVEISHERFEVALGRMKWISSIDGK